MSPSTADYLLLYLCILFLFPFLGSLPLSHQLQPSVGSSLSNFHNYDFFQVLLSIYFLL